MRRDERGGTLAVLVEAGIMLGASYLTDPANRRTAVARGWRLLAVACGRVAYLLGRAAQHAELRYWWAVNA